MRIKGKNRSNWWRANGLSSSLRIILKGYSPEIFEADNRLGGMAASFDFDG